MKSKWISNKAWRKYLANWEGKRNRFYYRLIRRKLGKQLFPYLPAEAADWTGEEIKAAFARAVDMLKGEAK